MSSENNSGIQLKDSSVLEESVSENAPPVEAGGASGESVLLEPRTQDLSVFPVASFLNKYLRNFLGFLKKKSSKVENAYGFGFFLIKGKERKLSVDEKTLFYSFFSFASASFMKRNPEIKLIFILNGKAVLVIDKSVPMIKKRQIFSMFLLELNIAFDKLMWKKEDLKIVFYEGFSQNPHDIKKLIKFYQYSFNANVRMNGYTFHSFVKKHGYRQMNGLYLYFKDGEVRSSCKPICNIKNKLWFLNNEYPEYIPMENPPKRV